MPTPEFDGKCAFALSLGPRNRAPAGKARLAMDIDGKTYYFFGAVPRFLFNLIPGSLQRAERHWAAG
ncbi:hypothetical protein [Amycolatopsis jejuensis]|uniref:hypothetical protein n=1 Tax=Amycolatopsis jejuensis TaxID=330084 RepID=UPI000526C983|nr:hypothetical protein [Amycolatopsis jejuensis]